ncbi:uncharacterized protein BYT42DRAFT_541628 [Radiomyces spectabilis]|uniref:uncharacterized protein n=1 Tax=Radiomyces spectabilis TaxID=64574 RepID=UPI00221FB1B2|nr:uncharacterized protein BYT42DRAFT_541628 [Radiomyces spectabilis]KAI8393337.1 hypothetical protein BYT42DRAFT_541628 [Radiomyces spectabilis]
MPVPISEGYDSDDTEYNYPYDFQSMKKRKPFRAPVCIVFEVLIDSGASVLVISWSKMDYLVPQSKSSDGSRRTGGRAEEYGQVLPHEISGEPRIFDGTQNADPLGWLKQMNNFKKVTERPDEEAI